MELNIEYIFILCVLYINDIGDDVKKAEAIIYAKD